MSESRPFDFTNAMTLLCEDVTSRLEEFEHIRMERVAVTFAQTRSGVSHGLQARLTPLRFEGGSITTVRGRQTWTLQRLFRNDHELLYILTFYLPRFLNHSFREKMITVFHEMYHVGPNFDGDIRRLDGRYHVHSHSQGEYDRQMGLLVDKYLSLRPPKELFEFLGSRFRTLHARHGGVVGLQLPIPKLIPVVSNRAG